MEGAPASEDKDSQMANDDDDNVQQQEAAATLQSQLKKGDKNRTVEEDKRLQE